MSHSISYAAAIAISLALLSPVLAQSTTPVQPQPPATSLPLTTYNGAAVPDWSEISFDTLGGMSSPGSFVAPSQLVNYIGFDPSVSWLAGTPVANIVRLGFLENAFGLQQLTLNQIAQSVGLDVANLTLKQFGLLNWQNLGNLVSAVPSLADLSVSEVSPIAALVGNGSTELVGNLIHDPSYADLPLTSILDSFKIGDIPGLNDAVISGFKNWQAAFISDIPGLSTLPFNLFPIPPSTVGAVAILDLPLSQEENITQNIISGSDVDGFSVACNQQRCDHVELGQPFQGDRWIIGQQQVKGGHNLLSSTHNGKESTGRAFTGNPNPEAEPFKLVLNEVNDQSGTATFGLAMHWCFHHTWPDPLPNPDCTPYFIEFPRLFTAHEKDTIYIGAGDSLTLP